MQQRVEQILRIRLDGAQTHDALQFASVWRVSERTIFNYIAAADALLVQRQEKSFDKLFARHVAQREALLARCINGADYSTAARILADSATLLGLYPAANVNLNHGMQPPAEPLDLSKLDDTQLGQLETILSLAAPAGAGTEPTAR